MRANPFYQLQSGAMVTGPAERLIEAFFAVPHTSHIQAWRWHEFTKHDAERMASVNAAMQIILTERSA